MRAWARRPTLGLQVPEADVDGAVDARPVEVVRDVRGPVVVGRELGLVHPAERAGGIAGAQGDQRVRGGNGAEAALELDPGGGSGSRQRLARALGVVAHPEHALTL